MSDQHPIYEPPAEPPGPYAPAPYIPGGPLPETPAAAPPKRKPTTLIILFVILGLLLCCVCGGVSALLFISGSETSETTETGWDTLTDEPDDPRLQEWLEWDPPVATPLAPMPDASGDLVRESLAIAAPGFELQDAVWWPGYYDAAEDWYYSDAYYVRATHPSSDSVSAAFGLWIQSDQMIAEDIPFEFDPDSEIVTSIQGGDRELLYMRQWDADGFELDTADDLAIWRSLGEDWPDATVVAGYLDDESGYYEVTLTKWHLYAVEEESPVVHATYENAEGEWTLLEWEYVDADESPDAGDAWLPSV